MPVSITSSDAACKLLTNKLQSYTKDGDIILGGVFPVYSSSANTIVNFTQRPNIHKCDKFYMYRYHLLLAMVFAIEEINQDPHLLPNITLGFRIYDSCYAEDRALQATIEILSGRQQNSLNYACNTDSKMVGIIGDLLNSASIVMATLLGIYRYPQISYGSGIAILSDKLQFPSFLRTLSNDDVQPFYLAALMKFFGWNWIGILGADNDFRVYDSHKLIEIIEREGICVAFYEKIFDQQTDEQLHLVINRLKKSSATVIFIYASMTEVVRFLQVALIEDINGKVWIAGAEWLTGPVFTLKQFWHILNGTIGMALAMNPFPGFQRFLNSIHPSMYPDNIFMRSFWEDAVRCKWPDGDFTTEQEMVKNRTIPLCTSKEMMEARYKGRSSKYVLLVHNAVYALAHALNDLLLCKQHHFSDGSCLSYSNFQTWQLLQYVRNVRFNNTSGLEIFFDANGDYPHIAELLNWQASPDGTSSYVHVGMFRAPASQATSAEKDFTSDVSTIQWSGGITGVPVSICSESCSPGYRKAAREGQPCCCFDCVLCSEEEFSNMTDASDCIKCLDGEWPTARKDGCQKKTVEFLSYKDPIGSTLASLALVGALVALGILIIFFRHSETPIVRANNRGLSYLLLLALVFCFLCSLIFIGYPTTPSCILRQTTFGIIFVLCISCILGKTLLVLIAFNATRPNSSSKMWLSSGLLRSLVFICTCIQVLICTVWLTVQPPFQEMNQKSQLGKIIIECNEGSSFAFWCMLGYMGLLTTSSFVVAFLARTLPDNFNEAKLITFSMLIFGAVWLSFIPVYLSTQGSYMVAVEIFAILSSSCGLLGCIFFPKCYIILLRPEMNTKEALMGKQKAKKRKH